MAGSLPLKNDVQLVTQFPQSRRQALDVLSAAESVPPISDSEVTCGLMTRPAPLSSSATSSSNSTDFSSSSSSLLHLPLLLLCFTHSLLLLFSPLPWIQLGGLGGNFLGCPTKKNDSQLKKLDGTKYTWSLWSPKLEGTRPTGPIGRLRLRSSSVCSCRSMGQTDGRTPDHYTDPALHIKRAASTRLLCVVPIHASSVRERWMRKIVRLLAQLSLAVLPRA